MKEYTIGWTEQTVPLTPIHRGTPWADAKEFVLEEFTWYELGPKPMTTGKALYDEDALYLWFDVEDQHISAEVTSLNGPTYQDSSVEFFAQPSPKSNGKYFNFEVNCCGQFKLGWQEPGWDERGVGRDLISPELAEYITLSTSISGTTKEPSSDDESWWIAVKLPFDVLRSFTGLDITPSKGTTWRGNFCRSGVESASQKGTWNPIETEVPMYHTPNYFGRLQFD
ncbi:carbohydrate-binding family 9-like protein [Haloferax sp. YSMS24]|uniref:carbohydrate-binding family 9-like protein n=1 Tax=Haloferax sp. YSMS24 TaxID=3388425 RepID=UPI00398D4BA1